jgi:16S rRNA (uracil1498-N3)-methyltransferase
MALDEEEARHAGRARRLAAGDEVVLTDGRGTTARAELLAAGRREARARVIERTDVPPDAPAIHVASALPKGDRLATLLSMATQLGIASFTPLVCRHSVVTPAESTPARWERILRESAKQSRRAHVPVVRAPRTPDRIVAEAGCTRSWVMDPEADQALGSAPDPGSPSHLVVVGPEGGLARDEIEWLVGAGAERVRLGRAILRVETAVAAAVAVLRGRFGP